MNTIDLTILIVLAVFALLGLIKGFIRQVGSLIGLFVGLFLAGKFVWPVAQYIRGGFAQYPAIADPLSYLVAFFLIFFVVTIIIGILVKAVDKVFNLFAVLPFLKTINRLGGAVLGLLEGAFFVAAVVYILISLPINVGLTEKINTTTTGRFFSTFALTVKPFLPDLSKIDLSKLLPPMQFTVPVGGDIPKVLEK
ncbi:MAG: CvpA family protein [bacterium]|nr:CvpA family protein [bacterium]